VPWCFAHVGGAPGVIFSAVLLACGSTAEMTVTAEAPETADGSASDGSRGGDAGADSDPCGAGQRFCSGACIPVTQDDRNCGACANACGAGEHCAAATCRTSAIHHVVLIVQENHTFDAYFGRYCQAAAGSNPTCTAGPSCCERAPDREPRGGSPIVLNDASNFGADRDHQQTCELQQINGGKMDGYVSGSTGADTCLGVGPSCASPNNFALADGSSVAAYWKLADGNALADRYFQPIAGGSSSNDMYLATAHFQFIDNTAMPAVVGAGCTDSTGVCVTGTHVTYKGETTIADLLVQGGKSFAAYADGLDEAKSAAPSCPTAPSYCPYASCIAHPIGCKACIYDPSDNPFEYFAQLGDTASMKDYTDLAKDVSAGTLPSFAFVKAREYRSEHPNVSTISDGIAFVTEVVQTISGSQYAGDTLVLLVWDEGGGFFDHVPPPTGIDTDDHGKTVPYGTRVPLLALGKFARKGAVSHVTMEHSSIVRFLEYNFLGPAGQLGANDAKVHNIGSLLDPVAVGVPIPE
jgi:phospholipase C